MDSKLLFWPAVLWISSTFFLVLGLSRPVVEIAVNVEGVLKDAIDQQPVIGLLLQERGFKLSEIASRLPASSSTRQSIVSSAIKLYRLKCFTAATLIFLFSITVPICKQFAFLSALWLSSRTFKRPLAITRAMHKWAMLDVFVLAMVVLTLSSATAWSAVLLDGFFWFLGYFFTAGALGLLLSRRFGSENSVAVQE
jgi:hypothetical protein